MSDKKVNPTIKCEGKEISYLNRDTEIFSEIYDLVLKNHPDVGAKNQMWLVADYFAKAQVKKKLDELSRQAKGKKTNFAFI